MAYQIPPRWGHGNVPTAALMNKYSDSLNAIKALCVYVAPVNVAVGSRIGTMPLFFIHRARYLFYEGSGQLLSVNDGNPVGNDGANSVALSASGVDGVYDLESIGWLAYGMRYKVTGVVWALEDD